jgi:RimJ/RimL family protein N-acetyltransferase
MAFDFQPTLKGPLLELRPLRSEDFEALYAVASDPLIWEQHFARDRHQRSVFSEFFQKAIESGGALLAIDSMNGEVIGSSRFHGYDPARSEIEIGWSFLARAYWGGAYNRELKQLMLQHAFQFVERVVLLVVPENIRSRRAVEKIGGVHIGLRPDYTGRQSFVYEIIRPRAS